MDQLKEKFAEIFEKNLWGSQESKSGSGSTMSQTQVLRNELPFLFLKYEIKSILDIPCGDFNWMKNVDLHGIEYIGADIVDSLIAGNIEKYPGRRFSVLDIAKDDLPKVDLVFVRDLFGHFDDETIFRALANIQRSGSRYLLATSFTKWDNNPNIPNGSWKCINLMIKPYTLKPIYLINEQCGEGYPDYNDKCMLLFDLSDLYSGQKKKEIKEEIQSGKIDEEVQLQNLRQQFLSGQIPKIESPAAPLVSTKNVHSKIVATDKVALANRKVKLIIPFIDKPFYLWQILVQMNNFRKMGYINDTVFLGSTFGGVISPELQKIADCPCRKAKFHLYQDNRVYTTYAGSLKPWSMSQYFNEFPEEIDTVYVYLDPDVIFLRKIDFSQFLGDEIWYEADTAGYLNTGYIKSKGNGLLEEMCMITGIDPEVVVANDVNAGGAQFIIKNNTFEFWHEVELLSTNLYKHMKSSETKYQPEWSKSVYPIQAWTAEMWATNWVLWKRGLKTQIHPDLNFHMANHPMSVGGHPFLHLSGTVDPANAFSKAKYQSSPFKEEIPDYPGSITSYYVKEIRETIRNFANLIW